ncbi:hypothetical protein AS149_37285 [Burkholderia cenocepacia]|nr:hypothetical protein AS149_37285 [Burkholderia cenocepacia]
MSTAQMYDLALQCVAEIAPDGRPIELSFTGEGEPLLNWRNTTDLVRLLPQLSPDFDAVRYCFSGLGASKLLRRIPTDTYPVRLQLSLHAARQEVRDKLVPNSAPLTEIRAGLAEYGERFSAVELNVVLQDGVNDSDEDLAALCAWGDPAWPILLNPVLGNGAERVGARTDHFEAVLRAAGRMVKRYSAIGSKISRARIYPLMRARPELR